MVNEQLPPTPKPKGRPPKRSKVLPTGSNAYPQRVEPSKDHKQSQTHDSQESVVALDPTILKKTRANGGTTKTPPKT